MKLAKVLSLLMALILVFVFISAPVAISGGGSTDKHPWDEDSVSPEEGGYDDFEDGVVPGDVPNEEPEEAVTGTGVGWFFQTMDFQTVMHVVTLYKGVVVSADGIDGISGLPGANTE